MAKANDNLDPEEQEILDSFNRGEWISKGENLDKYKESALLASCSCISFQQNN